jgi:uncharacterized protein YceK
VEDGVDDEDERRGARLDEWIAWEAEEGGFLLPGLRKPVSFVLVTVLVPYTCSLGVRNKNESKMNE